MELLCKFQQSEIYSGESMMDINFFARDTSNVYSLGDVSFIEEIS